MENHQKRDWNRSLMKRGFLEGAIFRLKHKIKHDATTINTTLKIMEQASHSSLPKQINSTMVI